MMKTVEVVVSFKCDYDVQSDDVLSWLSDMLEFNADYDAFEEITGYKLEELPEVCDFECYEEVGR